MSYGYHFKYNKPTRSVGITATTAGQIPLYVSLATSQSSNAISVVDSSGTTVWGVGALGTQDFSITNTAAGGDKGISLGITQNSTALTGTLEAAAFTATNGTSAAASGTIRGIEVKARAATSANVGARIGTLTAGYFSADAKNKQADIMRGVEISLDGGAGGTSTTATALYICNNSSATQTTSYGITLNDGEGSGGHKLFTTDIMLQCGATITNSTTGAVAFAGATAAGVNGYSFTTTAGTIASEAHGVQVTTTGTLASGKSLVGLNVNATAAGTAGAWLAGLFVNAIQPSKMVNGYLCAAELELNSTAANASDNAVLVLNSIRNHTGSPPACDPYIMLREYGTTYANALFRVFGDTGQGSLAAIDATKLVSQVSNNFEQNCDCAIRVMVGSTPVWLLATTSAAA